jgi:S-adenosylmethionine hydrolase
MIQPIISLTTDFGLVDHYVGTLKAVVLGICPKAALVDVCHQVHPQAVRQAAFVLAAAAPYFAPGAVHLVVVDPGVGSERRPIAVQTARASYVAPDNGVLSLALRQDAPRVAVHLTAPRYRLPQVSATFHGRDIFAPAAAHLACGVDPREMGEPVPLADLVTFPLSEPEPQPDGSWLGEVLHVDHFGNLITSFQSPISNPQYPIPNIQSPIPGTEPPPTSPHLSVEIAGQRIPRLSRTYADVAPGEFLAYVGSSGYLEIAIRERNAAEVLGVGVGAPVRIQEGA